MANDTRTRMLATTGRLLQLRGYHGTALNDILAESGAPRGSLYFHFPGGKDQLVLESTRAAVERITARRRELLEQAETPAAALHTVAETTAALLRETDFAVSCPIAPIILDGTTELGELFDLCRHAFQEWVGLLQVAFVRGGIPEKRAEALALLVQSALEGALLIARAYRDTAPLLSTAAELTTIVEAAVPQSRARKVTAKVRKPRQGRRRRSKL